MAKTKISEFDANPDNNTDINSINIAEGCAPSGINNAIRQLMADLKEFQTGAGGDSITAVGVNSDTISEKTSGAGVTVDGVLLKDGAVSGSGAFTSLSASGAFSANGGATLGDASGDALTINSSAVSIPNGLNFDSNTLVIDATNNNVGIGTSSPSYKLDLTSSSNVVAKFNYSGGASGYVYADANIVSYGSSVSGSNSINFYDSLNLIRLYTNGSERMRIDSSGNLLVGTTSSFGGGGVVSNTNFIVGNSGSYWKTTNFSATYYFAYNGTDKASINGSTGAYTALSDANKKKDFEASTLGLDAVMELKPTLFRMIGDEDDAPKQLGFIAQDVETVIPQAYTEQDAPDGKFIGLQDRPIIAVLTKAIQEQQAIITDLKARIENLESK